MLLNPSSAIKPINYELAFSRHLRKARIMQWQNPSSEGLKKEHIKRKIYASMEEAKSEIFEYIEVFYNRKHRHSRKPVST